MPKVTRASVMGEYEAVIRTAMARTLFVATYADYVEEHQQWPNVAPRPGGNWEDVAPPTNFMAMEATDDLVKRFAAIESYGPYQMAELFSHAMEADTGEPWQWPVEPRGSLPSSRKGASSAIELMQEFGSDVVMQSLGTGVSWFDDHKEFEIEFPRFECHLDDGDDWNMSWSGMAAGPREYGFDLTKFHPGGFQKVLKALGVVVASGSQHAVSGLWTWYWCGPGIDITCANDPVTGEPSERGRRRNEKDYASYMGIRGTPSVVMRAVALIRRHAESIKDENTERLAYIDFGPDAPGPQPVIDMPKKNPSEDGELEDEGPTEDDYVTTDYRDWYQYQKHVLTVPDDNWRVAVELHMAKENFWPNVWFISDHGNPQLLSLAYDNPVPGSPLPKGTRVNVTAPGDDTDVVGAGVVKYWKNGWYGVQLDGERRVDEYAPAQVFPADGRANPGKPTSSEWMTVAVVSADRSKDADATSSDLAADLERTFGVTTMREATYPMWRVLAKGAPKTIAKVRTYAQSWLANEGVAATRPNPKARSR